MKLTDNQLESLNNLIESIDHLKMSEVIRGMLSETEGTEWEERVKTLSGHWGEFEDVFYEIMIKVNNEYYDREVGDS